MFANNDQNEMNIHNLATDFFEVVYYFGTFLVFVFIPFLSDRFNLHLKWDLIYLLIPSRFITLIYFLAMAYNHDMWDVYEYQISFIMTMVVCIYYAFLNCTFKHPLLAKILVVVCILSQYIIVHYKHGMKILGSMSEYKEMFIALALGFYAWEIC